MARRCASVPHARAHAPLVTDTASALDAVELALPDDFDHGAVVLPLDRHRRARVALAFRGRWPSDLTPLVEVLLDGATPADGRAVVLALVRPGDDWHTALSADELAPWRDAVARLVGAGVEVTDFLVLGTETWASLLFDGTR